MMTTEARAALHEVLLQAAMRAERIHSDAVANDRAAHLACRGDKRAKEARQ